VAELVDANWSHKC